jgi:peptidoglycan/xylan/chitin deacetylase (PgdA/CDA1 family)
MSKPAPLAVWRPALLAALILSPCRRPPVDASVSKLSDPPRGEPHADGRTMPFRPARALEVAVTVDDLPAHGPLIPGVSRLALAERFIDAFRRHGLPPVYGFVNGLRVDEHPESKEVLSLWVRAGHRVGNHTHSHVSLNAVGLPEYFADLELGEAILDAVQPAWRSWKAFRYPFLFEGNNAERRAGVRRYLVAHGYTTAEVSVEADDWAFNPPFSRGDAEALHRLHRRFVAVHVEELERMRALTRELTGRDVRQVLLLHIGVADADALDDLLTAFEQAGVRWIALPEALADPFYAVDPGVPFPYGASFPYLVAKARHTAVSPGSYARGLERELALVCQ